MLDMVIVVLVVVVCVQVVFDNVWRKSRGFIGPRGVSLRWAEGVNSKFNAIEVSDIRGSSGSFVLALVH